MKEILTATRWMMMAAAITALLILLSVWRAAASDDRSFVSQQVLLSTDEEIERSLASEIAGDIHRFVWIADISGKARKKVVACNTTRQAAHGYSDHDFKIRR